MPLNVGSAPCSSCSCCSSVRAVPRGHGLLSGRSSLPGLRLQHAAGKNRVTAPFSPLCDVEEACGRARAQRLPAQPQKSLSPAGSWCGCADVFAAAQGYTLLENRTAREGVSVTKRVRVCCADAAAEGCGDGWKPGGGSSEQRPV